MSFYQQINPLYISANNTNLGQILTSNGTVAYWANASGGFANGQSIQIQDLVVNGAISANNSYGNLGQILFSNSTGVYWSSLPAVGFANGQSISVQNVITTGSFTANGTTGTLGQILFSNGTAAYWSSLPAIGFANGQSINVNSINVQGFFTANGSSGTAGQILTSNGTSVYWTSVGASYVQNTDSRTLSGNIAFTGANSTFTGNLTITSTGELILAGGAGISANGSFGTLGQVLHSNGTSIYWGPHPQVGFANGQSINVNSINVQGFFTANGSSGTLGQVLHSNGTSVYWGPHPQAGFANGQSIQVQNIIINDAVSSNNIIFANTINVRGGIVSNGSFTANGSTGTLGQVLHSNGTSTYWGPHPQAGFANGQNIQVQNSIVLGTLTANSFVSNSVTANGSTGSAGQVLTSNGTATYWANTNKAGSAWYSTSAPSNPWLGQLWFNTALSILNVWYDDGTGGGGAWVPAVVASGGGGGGGGASSIFAFYNGLNDPQIGTLRRYYGNDLTMTRLAVWVSEVSSIDLTVRLNKNGVPVASVTVPAGLSLALSSVFSSILRANLDYITIDIASGSGTDIGIRIDYTS